MIYKLKVIKLRFLLILPLQSSSDCFLDLIFFLEFFSFLWNFYLELYIYFSSSLSIEVCLTKERDLLILENLLKPILLLGIFIISPFLNDFLALAGSSSYTFSLFLRIFLRFFFLGFPFLSAAKVTNSWFISSARFLFGKLFYWKVT